MTLRSSGLGCGDDLRPSLKTPLVTGDVWELRLAERGDSLRDVAGDGDGLEGDSGYS